jgi:hypothetical protein
MPNSPQQLEIFRPIIAATTATFHRFNLGKLLFPEAKHVLGDIQLLRDLADGAEGFG